MVSGNGMYKKNNSKNGKRSNSEDEQQLQRKESANETISVNQEAARFATQALFGRASASVQEVEEPWVGKEGRAARPGLQQCGRTFGLRAQG